MKHRLLIIDTDEKMLKEIITYLEDKYYDVFTATNIETATSIFQEHDFDLIIYDLKMTYDSRLSLIELFRSERPDIPIIILYTLGQTNEIIEALRQGAVDYLMKPLVSFDDCLALIKITLLKNNDSDNYHQASSFNNDCEQARLELDMNLKILKSDQKAEMLAQLQMLPEPKVRIGDYLFQHTIIRSDTPGSDFLDFFEIDERYIGFYIADISANNNDSAFITMMLKSMINQPLRAYRKHTDNTIVNPSQLLEHLNQEMIAAAIGKYTSLFYAVIDRKENKLIFSLGGQFPRPILLNDNKRFTFQEDSFPVGLFKWAEYEQQSVPLKMPFTLGMFSHGVLNVLNDQSVNNAEEKLTKFCSNHYISIPDLVKKLQLTAESSLSEDVSLFLVQRS
ncbi:MAG: fused response regulator/phosphatase [Gammaproteobacteria bacterium]|nr:fused response regulator/phosphatase [Gammaproteobacteria bacterium]